ncbi:MULTISPECIES: hypothetical protein [unclassified Methylobacterium]|jgi:hypothetical protein|uniref:hypothetical protein n=1 Tax=unclassified Methylobacterium TaxID=2615210 RepID=UPI001355AAAF|nr:hypothetical protein [Methylobacterium sp. 2A]MWV22194.1 hypothetical protein [Methylobacterium sp. 2A]
MREYLVTFHETVPDDTRHAHRVRQRQAVVTVRSVAAAASSAKAMRCEADGLIDWRLRADTRAVSELREQAA